MLTGVASTSAGQTGKHGRVLAGAEAAGIFESRVDRERAALDTALAADSRIDVIAAISGG